MTLSGQAGSLQSNYWFVVMDRIQIKNTSKLNVMLRKIFAPSPILISSLMKSDGELDSLFQVLCYSGQC